MHIPPGGGPPPHRHDFEETFILLEGEMQATFRGRKSIVRAGETLHIPANAPHQIHNVSSAPARMLCVCSPAGLENFFVEVGVAVATRTTPPPELNQEEGTAFIVKVRAIRSHLPDGIAAGGVALENQSRSVTADRGSHGGPAPAADTTQRWPGDGDRARPAAGRDGGNSRNENLGILISQRQR